MSILIKEASLDELDELMDWRMRVLQTVFRPLNLNEYSELFQANKTYYQRAIPAGEHVAVFAEKNGRKVGCGGVCLYQEMPSPDNLNGRCAYLMNIFTLEEYRNQGIAREVVKWLVDCARVKGINKIYLETTNKARGLYESLDFKDLKDYMIFGGIK